MHVKRGIAAMATIVAAFAIVLVVVGAVTGANEAAKHGLPDLALAERDAVLREAHGFWDNPFERLVMFSMAVTSADRVGSGPCRTYEVTAYTFFGNVASTVETDCSGGMLRTS
jgi:hypothetical protein